ncbi:hypothetical protein D2A34_01735 [Clostridium chromiireducens]|uniref:YfhO family protein n=1 Tax=Clostridium chromiireducens TaxID=225345 RepID=A0A399IT26_9CLOT|nr:hypothetical protein [Clostridium chromiireducens]RII36120.1 hypothetical protein D2A34_01735 [Clostridium chromiireducens]
MIISSKEGMVKKSFWGSDTFMFMLIIILSIVILSIITFANPNVFLVDDNILQWEPIINKSFENLFSKGYIPFIDFYQYKMFNILDPGYYSLNNPIMLISYVLRRFIFSSHIGSISIYIYIMFMLGNSVMYLLLRRLNISKINTCIAVLVYSSVSHFIHYGFYYFTFNNYFFIPFLILVISSFNKNKLSYFATGICLAFSLLLGHIQYTFYYYMVYAIIMIFMAFTYNRRYIIIMLTNVIVGIILSSPQLLALVLISGNRSDVIQTTSDFLKIPILWDNLIIFFAMPLYLFRDGYQMISSGGALRDQLDYLSVVFGYFGALVPLYGVFISNYFKKIQCFIYESLRTNMLKLSDKLVRGNIFFEFLCYISICFLMIWIVGIANIDVVNKLTFSAAVLIIAFALVFMRISKRTEIEKWEKVIIAFLMIYYPFVTAVIAIYYFIKDKICVGNAFPLFDDHNEDKKAEIFNNHIIIACAVASIFFILFSIGKSGIIAIVLSKIPIINTFRFLYKCVFISIPLMVMPAAFALNNIKKKRKSIIAFIVALSIIGISNSSYLINSGIHTYFNNERYPYNNGTDYAKNVLSRIDEIGADKNNYRFLAITEGNESFAENSYIESSSVDFCDKMTKNMSTMVGVFTLAGYDNTFAKTSYNQSNLILSDINLNNMYTNAVNGHETFSKFTDLADNDPKLRKFYYQLRDNAVKYYLFDKDATNSLNAFKRLCDKLPEVRIIQEVDFVNNTILIEIDGVDSLCKTNGSKSIPLNSEMDELNFDLGNEPAEYVTLSFTYSKNYRAIFTAPDGNKKKLNVVDDDSGYTKVITENVGKGTVTLYYNNQLDNLVMFFSIVICILLLCIIIIMLVAQTVNENNKLTNFSKG